jgi:hypothetical protein
VRNVIDTEGGATVDRGHIVFMSQWGYETFHEPPQSRASLYGLLGMVLAVLAAVLAVVNGWVV